MPVAGDWTLMRAHIHNVLARGDANLAAYISGGWHGRSKTRISLLRSPLVFRGEPGTGKGVFGRAMAQLFGQHGLHTGGSELITGRFHFALSRLLPALC